MYDANTRKDDLHKGKPYWLATPHISVRITANPWADQFDVIVVGAGISGALAAEALTRMGKSVLVVDRRPPVTGSTPASTAMIQHEIDVPLTRLQHQNGARVANAAWRRSVRAVNDLVALTGKLNIRCGMQPKSTLYLAGDELDGKQLDVEAKARRKIGIDAEFLTHTSLKTRYGLDRDGAILSQDSASANPAQLAAGLLRVAARRGATIASPIDVTDMAELHSGVALATSDGRVLTATHVVFCSGYEFLPQMRSKLHHVTSTWALATAPRKSWPAWLKQTIVWEAADPYLYFRLDATGRLIAGGEDEDAAEKNSSQAVLHRKTTAIVDKLEQLTGFKLGKPTHSWGAPFSVTTDGLPIIDRVKGYDRVFAVMGFGGNGITFSMIAAQIVTSAIVGAPDADARLFALR